MSENSVYDVLIIGGGPAGSTAATFLARAGYKVILFEKEKFPRPHVGESLVPFCHPLFEELGVLNEMCRRFVRKPGIRFVNADGTASNTWCFRTVIDGPSNLSFHVLRAPFDKILLDNSIKNGAEVREETKITNVKLETENELVEVQTNQNGDKKICRAKFLLDASGQNTFLSQRLRIKRPYEDLSRSAFLTHWSGGEIHSGN